MLSEEDAVTQKTPKRSVRNTAQRTALKQMWITNPLERNERAESLNASGPAVVPLTPGFLLGFLLLTSLCRILWRSYDA